MLMQNLSRNLTASTLIAFLCGCASNVKTVEKPPAPVLSVNECAVLSKSCVYEGSYDKDERGYAEQEAKRLNQDQKIRLVSSVTQPVVKTDTQPQAKETKETAAKSPSKTVAKNTSKKAGKGAAKPAPKLALKTVAKVAPKQVAAKTSK